MAVENVKLGNKSSPDHLCMEAVRLKLVKETDEERSRKEKIEKSKKKKGSPDGRTKAWAYSSPWVATPRSSGCITYIYNPSMHCPLGGPSSSSSMIRFTKERTISPCEKKGTIQYGDRKWGTHDARVIFRTLAHGNSMNEKRSTKKVKSKAG